MNKPDRITAIVFSGLCKLLLLCIIILTPWSALADPLHLTVASEKAPLAGHLEAFKDESGKLSIQDVLSPAYSKRFTAIPGILSAGFYQHGAIWLRCTVQRAANSPSEWVLEAAPAYNELLELYTPTATGGFDIRRGGTLVPYSKRDISYRHDLFRLNFDPSLPTTIYFRIESRRSITVEPILWHPHALRKKIEKEALIHGAYIGVILLVAIFNLMYLAWLKKPLYGYYFFYVLSIGYLFFNTYGYVHQYIFPEKTWFIAPVTFINYLLLLALNTGLMSEMLELRRHLPRTDRVIRTLFFGIAAAGIVLILCGYHYQIIRYIHVSLFACATSSIIISALLIRRAPGAGIYLSAFGVLLVSGVAQILSNLGIMSNNTFSDNLFTTSTFIHVFVLNIAVLNQVICLMREKYTVEAALAKEQQTVANQRQFLRLISHEMRTPLAIIDSTAQIIPFVKDDGDQVVRNAEAIRTATRKLSELMSTYLTHDRLVSGGMQPDFRPLNMCDFLRNLVAQFQLTADNHHIDCELPDSTVIFSCDPMLIEILVRLLLENAVKYSPGGRAVVLRATFRSAGELCIEVADCGSGMTPEQIDHAFEPYYRAHAIPGVGGFGLGLNLAKHIAEIHGGSISISSIPQKGSTFSVHLKQVSP